MVVVTVTFVFLEDARRFRKQIDVMRSLQIYDDRRISKDEMDIPVGEVVNTICEPIASKQRLNILKITDDGFQEFHRTFKAY
ncbi:MAG: hypothetical protein JW705_00445 [Methanosarcinaceae archaeon]|nr:hypothetical protein [Methanosarcinaceae archaeon]